MAGCRLKERKAPGKRSTPFAQALALRSQERRDLPAAPRMGAKPNRDGRLANVDVVVLVNPSPGVKRRWERRAAHGAACEPLAKIAEVFENGQLSMKICEIEAHVVVEN